MLMDRELDARVSFGRSLIADQIPLFQQGFAQATSQWKTDGTRVTEYDLRLSKNIGTAVNQAFPTDDVCCEESVRPDQETFFASRFSWVVDPIDGTNNYALGLPNCALSLALLDGGYPRYGFVYDHARRAVFEGGPGYGCRLDNRSLPRPCRADTLHPQCILAMHTPMPGLHDTLVGEVLRRTKLRAYGSATLHILYAAIGYLDGSCDFAVKVWDIAAAYAMASALGLEVEFLGKSPFPLRCFVPSEANLSYVAGSRGICRELSTLLHSLA